MYACGDVAQPEPASVALLEEMTVEYLTDLCHRARPSPYSVPVPVHLPTVLSEETPERPESAPPLVPLRTAPHPFATRQRVKVDDLKTALRRDDKKLGRIEELLYLDTVITKARRGFDDPGEYEAEEARAEERARAQQAQAGGSAREGREEPSGKARGIALPGARS
jgi:transcription initiation factor TFIID subunit 13